MNSKYEFDKEKCWYKEACNLYKSADCYAGCIRYMEMFHLMNTSGIPEKRQYPVILLPEECDYEAFVFLRDKIKANIVDFVRSGKSLYIYSEGFGNGKTTWAIKMMQSYFDKIWSGNGFKTQGQFVHVPTFMKKLTDTIKTPDDKFEQVKELITKVPLAILDDITACGLKEFTHTHLLSIVDIRTFNGLSTIFTGNLGGDKIDSMLGSRLASRVFNQSVGVELFGIDRRGDL